MQSLLLKKSMMLNIMHSILNRHAVVAQRTGRLVTVLLLVAFSVAYVNTAWVSEDAFISFRTIDNLLNGYGLTWNPGQRVQSYTHPLWLALLLPAVDFVGDPYIVSLLAGFIFTAATIVVLLDLAKPFSWYSLIGVGGLLWSRAFVDYSSSGLENSLSHTLIAMYAWCWLKLRSGVPKGLALSFLLSALFLTRPDNVVLVACSLAVLICTRPISRDVVVSICIGLFPAIVWVAFSIFYYGSPVPNTALAKVNTGATLIKQASQAWAYVGWSFENDIVTLVIIVLGVACGMHRVVRESMLPLAIGLIAWGGYLVYVGADYMGGRFFSTASVLAVSMLAHAGGRCRIHNMLLFGTMVVSLGILRLTLLSPPDFEDSAISQAGIADERGYYYRSLGLIPVLREGTWHSHAWLRQGAALRGHSDVFTRANIGMSAYAAGPSGHWIDPYALAEPFLARLPARINARVGHYERAFPPGFLESELVGANELVAPELAALYDDVNLATRAPLLADRRWAAIWRLNTGFHSKRITAFDRNAVGLPNVVKDSSAPLSVYGVSDGGVGTWLIEGPPIRATRVRPPL